MADRKMYDRFGGVTRSIVTHESDPEGQFHVQTSQDMTPVIDTVTSMREANQVVGHRKSRNMVPVAEIPMVIYEQAMREGWAEDQAAWRRWLNDPDNKAFRITDGRV